MTGIDKIRAAIEEADSLKKVGVLRGFAACCLFFFQVAFLLLLQL